MTKAEAEAVCKGYEHGMRIPLEKVAEAIRILMEGN